MGTARQYDKNYKEQAVKLASENGCKAASEELGIPYDTLYGWIKAARRGELHLEGRDRSIEEENQRLRQANKELAKENKRFRRKTNFLRRQLLFSQRAESYGCTKSEIPKVSVTLNKSPSIESSIFPP